MIYDFYIKVIIKMSFPLYHHNGNYYLLIDRGMSFNYVIDFHNFSARMVSNDDLQTYGEIELNRENLIHVLTAINKMSGISLEDFDKFKYNHIIINNGTPYYANTWRDVMNIIRSR